MVFCTKTFPSVWNNLMLMVPQRLKLPILFCKCDLKYFVFLWFWLVSWLGGSLSEHFLKVPEWFKAILRRQDKYVFLNGGQPGWRKVGTLGSGINVGSGISVGVGKFGKTNKRRVWNNSRGGKKNKAYFWKWIKRWKKIVLLVWISPATQWTL